MSLLDNILRTQQIKFSELFHYQQNQPTRNRVNGDICSLSSIQQLITQQNAQFHKLNATQNHNKQKYTKTCSQQNEDQLSTYIQQIAITKSSAVSYFESLRASIKTAETLLLNEISKQEQLALSIKSNIQSPSSIDHLFNVNDKILKAKSKNVHSAADSIDMVRYLQREHTKTLSAFAENNERIYNNIQQCNTTQLSMSQIDEAIYNVSHNMINIFKIIQFNTCSAQKVYITNIDVINTQCIRIHFHIKPNISFKEAQVLYNISNNIHGNEWFQARVECISTSYNMIVFINNHNKNEYDNFLNVKIRFNDTSDDIWSPFSNIYTVSISREHQTLKHIFYLSQDLRRNPFGLYIANKDSNTSKPCHVIELEAPHALTIRKREKWLIKYAGICYAKNILLPPMIKDKVCMLYDDKSTFNCLFKCGGIGSTYCSSIIFNESDLFSNNKSFAINWDLPSFPEHIDCNDITYSERYGLLSVGGWEFDNNSDKFYRLSFNSEEYFSYMDWKWEMMPDMQMKRSWPSIVMLDEYDKLMVIGGKGAINTVEMFNFVDNKWMNTDNIHYGRSNAGVCHDVVSNKVYIGGGLGALNKVEYYDLRKDKWYRDIAETNKEHRSRPVMWIGDAHLLYISSIQSDSMEYIDLRINAKKWNVVYGHNYNRLWHRVFGTHFAKNENCRLCLG